jgi:hypothetical protein
MAYLDMLFPRTQKQRQAHQVPVRWQRVESILMDERVTPPGTGGTLWALYNAVTRDEDYRASREGDPSGRLDRIWFGSGEALKVRGAHRSTSPACRLTLPATRGAAHRSWRGLRCVKPRALSKWQKIRAWQIAGETAAGSGE